MIFSALVLVISACRGEAELLPETGDEGKDITVNVQLGLPEMSIATRANLEEYLINQVESVWIRTYSASGAGMATMDSWLEIPGKAIDPHDPKPVQLDTKSGPTYIVAVANIGNAEGVTKDDLTIRPLADLLKAADTWQKFLDIAVAAPSSYYDINEPPTPLVMAGCFIADGAAHPSIEEWQTAGFTSYDIQPTGTGTFTLKGEIHLRRIVSQMTFNLIPGDGISITPNSYRVVNAPVYSWLYEHDASRQANFGDKAGSADEASGYYTSTDIYPGTSFEHATITENGSQKNIYRFSFWQAENKHDGLPSCTDYNHRQIKTGSDGVTLFTSLTGDIWTPNNMASYVIINCSVDHDEQLKVDDNGNENNIDGKEVHRSGNASYIIHLGYLNSRATDFNAYRNTKYTFNVHINGVDQIRVEAFRNGDTNGVEGLVTDVLNPTHTLDCHYHAYNIELTEDDLKHFGFITTTYDSGVAHTLQDLDFEIEGTNPKEYREPTEQEKEYFGWVELRPTTDASTLAEYKPASGEHADGKTANLLEATRGLTDAQKSTTGWYTVFVNEYTYENDSDESKTNNWQRYVNQPSRRFYIRVTREISDDLNSMYARSKYAGIQRSIQTYYSNREIPEGGGIIGAEHENETFGLNVSRTYTYADNAVNGRYNVWLWLNGITSGKAPESGIASKKWNEVTLPKVPQHIYAVEEKQGISIPEHYSTVQSSAYGQARLIPYVDMFPLGNETDSDKWIEAVNACMNRNRDNNGDGNIDPEELRWYVPARGKYLRLILGEYSLATPLADFNAEPQLITSGGKGDEVAIKDCTRLMMFSSDGSALMMFNGTSSSYWYDISGSFIASTPWDVRCIRNLGTNLGTVLETDKTVPAYVHDEASRTVSMTYYDINSYRRGESFSGNGNADGKMPVHIINEERYNRPFAKFQYSAGEHELRSGVQNSRYDGILAYNNTYLVEVENKINTNPCNSLGDGWRLPNISELSIMRNLGIFDGFYTLNSSGYIDYAYIISCTRSYYDSNGWGHSVKPDTERNFLGIAYDNTLELPSKLDVSYPPPSYQPVYDTDRKLEKNAYYRCVRDVEP